MDNNTKKIVDDIINYHAELFINNFTNEIIRDKSIRTHTGDIAFPIFKSGNEEYYKYRQYEKRIEVLTKNHLIKGILSDFFKTPNFQIHPLAVTFIPLGQIDTNSINNYEQKIPLEFLIQVDDSDIGYRFTDLDELEYLVYKEKVFADYIINNLNIKQIVILTFNELRYKHNNSIDIEYVSYVNFDDFLEEHFDKDICDYYIKRIKETVNIANEISGYKTITQLSLRNLESFKGEVLKNILSFIDDFDEKYYVLEKNGKSLEKIQLNSLLSIDEIRNNLVSNNHLINALVGDCNFAQSFITSEYLYNVLKNNNYFDCTSIVCGYIKSIEQLLYILIKDITIENTIDNAYSNSLWITSKKKLTEKTFNKLKQKYGDDIRTIKRNKKTITQIRVKKQYEDIFNYELGSAVYFLEDNKEFGIWNKNFKDAEKVISWLDTYRDMYRNEYFHKTNIETIDFNKVERIRNNTAILILILLGAFKMPTDSTLTKKLLGIDSRFYSFKRELSRIPKAIFKFHFLFDGNINLNLLMLPINDFSEDDTPILFLPVSSFEGINRNEVFSSVNPENVLRIDNELVPIKAYFIGIDGKEKEIIW